MTPPSEEQGRTGPEVEEAKTLLRLVTAMSESNPMLGLRGCRLSIVYPEIVAMQVQAITEAAVELARRGHTPLPKIMVPLVADVRELEKVRAALEPAVQRVLENAGVEVPHPIGTMIEIPRAALQAGRIAEQADFFSFGTNDLTQMTYGFSRDDAEGKFLDVYLSEGVMKDNPFQVLDRDGVGELIRLAVERGRATRPGLEVGICGEHGGDPSSIAFCHEVGLDYVSCSPYRVPVARLAAAQAALAETANERDR
ncbi:MAG: hypothetical protein NTZ05_21035 [Chloroflexi bacterium]|nr:hypothetical protein [Chloroflexota bacterium]